MQDLVKNLIKVKDEKIFIYNEKGKEISFNINDKKFLSVIQKNIDKFGIGVKCEFTIEVKSINEQYIIINNFRIKTPPAIINEIMPRLLLLNKVKYPSNNIGLADEN